MRGVASLDQLPGESGPEVAFAGRSNVGKSSLLNALVGRQDLARASATPGRTQEINYFNLGGRVRLVDLPGYGYARAARKDVDRWTQLMRAFLTGRATLRRVFLLVDARHGLKESDEDLMTVLDGAAVNYQLVLTKSDKVKPSAIAVLNDAIAQAIAKRPAAHPMIHATSAGAGAGIPALRAEIAALIEGS